MKEDLSDDTRDALIQHKSTRFFVNRKPRFQGIEVEHDINGQEMNGVLKVSMSIDINHTVWSPICKTEYEDAKDVNKLPQVRASLANSIIDILYTVRNNTFHGSKTVGEERDEEVVLNALPLLQIVVQSSMLNQLPQRAIDATALP
jgi:hypothetical protein